MNAPNSAKKGFFCMSFPFQFNCETKIFGDNILTFVKELVQCKLSPYVSSANTIILYHGGGWTNPAINDSEESKIEEMSFELFMRPSWIIEHNVDEMINFLLDFADKQASQMIEKVFRTIKESCQNNGNVLERPNDLPVAETIIQMLEAVEFSVDRNGNVTMPQICSGSQMHEKILEAIPHLSPEYHQKCESIKARKIQEAIQKEQCRLKKFKGLQNG